MYYIQNKNAGYIGNAIVFWQKGRAERFIESEAKMLCLGNPEKNIAWPIDYIDFNEGNQKVTDMQYLKSENIKKF